MRVFENTTAPLPQRSALPVAEIAQLAGDFFMNRGAVYETMHRLVRRLEEENSDYAVIRAMALAAHGYPRLTLDIDLLLTAEGLQAFHERLVGRGYLLAFAGARKTFRKARRAQTGFRHDRAAPHARSFRRAGFDYCSQTASRLQA